MWVFPNLSLRSFVTGYDPLSKPRGADGLSSFQIVIGPSYPSTWPAFHSHANRLLVHMIQSRGRYLSLLLNCLGNKPNQQTARLLGNSHDVSRWTKGSVFLFLNKIREQGQSSMTSKRSILAQVGGVCDVTYRPDYHHRGAGSHGSKPDIQGHGRWVPTSYTGGCAHSVDARVFPSHPIVR